MWRNGPWQPTFIDTRGEPPRPDFRAAFRTEIREREVDDLGENRENEQRKYRIQYHFHDLGIGVEYLIERDFVPRVRGELGDQVSD